jgi:hypothetical protein
MGILTRRNPFGVEVSFKSENNDVFILHPFFNDKYVLLTKLIEDNVITEIEFNFFRKSVNELGYRIILKPKIEKRYVRNFSK